MAKQKRRILYAYNDGINPVKKNGFIEGASTHGLRRTFNSLPRMKARNHNRHRVRWPGLWLNGLISRRPAKHNKNKPIPVSSNTTSFLPRREAAPGVPSGKIRVGKAHTPSIGASRIAMRAIAKPRLS
jgi:hypothetical protein